MLVRFAYANYASPLTFRPQQKHGRGCLSLIKFKSSPRPLCLLVT